VAHHLAARRGGVVPCLRCHADGGSALPLKPPGPRNGLDCITAQAAYIVCSTVFSRFDSPAAFTIILLGAASLPDRPQLGPRLRNSPQAGPPTFLDGVVAMPQRFEANIFSLATATLMHDAFEAAWQKRPSIDGNGG
jgi:hypothetical protein